MRTARENVVVLTAAQVLNEPKDGYSLGAGERDSEPDTVALFGVQGRVPLRVVANAARRVPIPPSPRTARLSGFPSNVPAAHSIRHPAHSLIY